jgi:hypothetical protein
LIACDTLIPTNEDENINIARAMFEESDKAGYVDNFVLAGLRRILLKRNYVQLVDSTKSCSAGLPGSWTRNIFSITREV